MTTNKRKTKVNKGSKQILLFFLLLWNGFVVSANDTTTVLSAQRYLQLVMQHHPLIKQTDLVVKEATAKLLSAKGAFDPVADFSFENKTLDGNRYYQYLQPQLKAPLWYGIELKAELSDVRGSNTANELTYGNSVAVGVSLPLLSGLVMNKKMAVLKQAKNNIQLSKAEQQNTINTLLLDAIDAYWDWNVYYQEYFYNIQAKEVSYNRLQFTKRMFEVGERPAIDTVEAFAQYKLLEYETQKSYYNWVKSAIELSLFLWDENEQAVFIKDNITPLIYNTRYLLDSITLPSLNDLELLVLNHPKLNAFDIKLKNLEIERKLKFQNLLPTLNVNYNFINKSYNPFYNVGDNLLLNNYKIGVDFKMPLMFREARGEYKQAKIKIESTQIDKVVVQNELNVKVKTYYNDLVALKENLRLYNETFLAYETLLKGENTRFENGESSLFLINSRQNKVLETRLKMNELESKLMKYQMSVYLLAGQQPKN